MKHNLLLTPGPTKVLPQASEALGRPIIHHRTPQFQQYLKEAVDGLKYVYQTKNDVYVLTSSGTGAMEACVANLLSPGDKAITVEGGKFGERWTELCQAYGIEARVIQVPWGDVVDPKQIKNVLDKEKDIKAVFVTLAETSTGVTTDVKAVADVVKKTDAVLVVDAVSGLGVVDCQTDTWSLDMVASASHKGLMLPPGLGFVSVSEKAKKMIQASKNRRYYFDLRKSQKAWEDTDTPFTSAIGIVIGLVESLKWMKAKGLQNLFAHYAHLAQGTREAAKALGLTLFPKEHCISNVLTAINLPLGIDGEKLVKTLRDTYGISMAPGQGHLKGKIVRLAHMGCLEESDILTGIVHLERVLQDMGYKFQPKAGEVAAQRVFSS